jgi:hypothetical protein
MMINIIRMYVFDTHFFPDDHYVISMLTHGRVDALGGLAKTVLPNSSCYIVTDASSVMHDAGRTCPHHH